MSIKVIYGKAGTGKTTYLAKLISDAIKNNKSFYVLSYTHSAVNLVLNPKIISKHFTHIFESV